MKIVVKASIEDLIEIVKIDSEVIGSTSRRDYIGDSIKQGQCLIVKDKDIAGFLIYDTYFFGYCFISLIIVSSSIRRKGYASVLIDYMMSISPTTKVFSSTTKGRYCGRS